METRVLGKTGLEIVPIGFGGIPIQRVNQEKVVEIIDALEEEGLNFIDTARGYTVSEGFLGNALQGRRDKFILATKSMAKTYEAMKAEIETSLDRLQTDYIDLYQCHLIKDKADYDFIMGPNGAYKALVEAKEEGKIGHVGMTAHSADLVREVIEDMPFETLQFPYNLVESQGTDLFAIAKRRHIGVIVMKPIAGGAISNGVLSLKFILQNDNVSVAIPGMEMPEEVVTNAKVARGPYGFNPVEQEEATAIVKELHGNFCRRCGYCLPCPQNINIPAMFIAEGYKVRYKMEGYAATYYGKQAVKASACIQCGNCEPKCPYDLPIIEKMKQVASVFGE